MLIDCHTHWIPPALADLLGRRRVAPCIVRTEDGERFVAPYSSRPFDAGLYDLDSRLALMERQGVAMQVLSLAGLFGIDCLPLDESAPLVRAFNDATIEAQRAHPRRLAGLAALPLADPSSARRELERCLAAGMRGAILPADGFCRLSLARAYTGLFEAGEQAKCHFFIHPGPIERPPPDEADTGDNAWLRRIVIQAQERLSQVMVTLNLTDFLDAYPGVTVQVANLGGAIPFLLERMDRVAGDGPRQRAPSRRFSRCYVDTASFGRRAIELAVAAFGSGRVLLGTDCPIFDTGHMVNELNEARLDISERERIGFRNALALFTPG